MLAREHWSFEGVDRHELLVLAHLLGDARVPVLDLHKDALAVVVARVADVQRPAWVPAGRPRPAADVPRRELHGYLLDDVLKRVIGEVPWQAEMRQC